MCKCKHGRVCNGQFSWECRNSRWSAIKQFRTATAACNVGESSSCGLIVQMQSHGSEQRKNKWQQKGKQLLLLLLLLMLIVFCSFASCPIGTASNGSECGSKPSGILTYTCLQPSECASHSLGWFARVPTCYLTSPSLRILQKNNLTKSTGRLGRIM